jgi:hypothetical protein
VFPEIYNELELNNNHQMVKDVTLASTNNESTSCRLMYSGTSTAHYSDHSQAVHIPVSGHKWRNRTSAMCVYVCTIGMDPDHTI